MLLTLPLVSQKTNWLQWNIYQDLMTAPHLDLLDELLLVKEDDFHMEGLDDGPAAHLEALLHAPHPRLLLIPHHPHP